MYKMNINSREQQLRILWCVYCDSVHKKKSIEEFQLPTPKPQLNPSQILRKEYDNRLQAKLFFISG